MSFDLKISGRDIVEGSNGDLAVVENEEKLIQDILKMVLTPLNANPFFPWYGSPVNRTLIGKSYDFEFVSSVAKQQLTASLERLQEMQREQMRYEQVVTPQEQIAAIRNVHVGRLPNDPRFYTVFITVLNKAFRNVNTSFTVSL